MQPGVLGLNNSVIANIICPPHLKSSGEAINSRDRKQAVQKQVKLRTAVDTFLCTA